MTSPFFPASPIEIRDGTKDRIAALGLFRNVFKARTAPTQDEQLPLACVWNAGERTQPNGDANVGAPEFLHTLTLAVDIMTRAPSETSADADIVTMVETVRATLLSDLTWVSLFDGIERFDTRYLFPKEAGNILVQAVIEIDVTYRSIWAPVTPHDLNQVFIYSEPQHPVVCQMCGTTNESRSAFSGVRPECCRVCDYPLPNVNDPILTVIE